MLGFGAIGVWVIGTGPLGQASSAPATLPPFGQSSDSIRKAGLAVAVAATAISGFVVPPQPAQATAFAESAAPLTRKPVVFEGTSNAPQPGFFRPPIFAQSDVPFSKRISIPNEQQPNPLFDIQPPPPPPFTGFASFTETWRIKPANVAIFSDFGFVASLLTSDTHDGIWIKRKKPRSGPDPIDLELEEKAQRRAAIELAAYGPPVEYPEPSVAFPATPPSPPDVSELARVVAAAQANHHQAVRTQQDAEEEAELESILREIL